MSNSGEIWGEEKDPEKLEKAVNSKEMASELKSEVNEIFDIYLERFHEEEEHNVDKKLEKTESGTGKLFQCLINLDETWYMIAQYRGMYLVIKSRENEFFKSTRCFL